MTKAELIEKIASDLDVKKVFVENVLRELTHLIIKEVRDGNDVSIPNLGTFKQSSKNAREGINPSTGEKILIPARTVPKFTPAKAFKDIVSTK